MLTTKEAAELLGVSSRRVVDLIGSGTLSATKVSGVWLVDEESVRERKAAYRSKKGGRPARGHGSKEARFMLMNRTHEIAPLVYNMQGHEFTYIGDVLDASRVPIGVATREGRLARDAFNTWWRGRGIPATRTNLAALLEEAGVAVAEELLVRNLGLSLSDQYWICPEGSGLAWQDVNFFHNSFETVSDCTARVAVEGRGASATPDNTSDGNLEKMWECRGAKRVLKKRGARYGQEPYGEVVATALHRRLLHTGDYVRYKLEGTGANAWCVCKDFCTDEEEYVPALYVSQAFEQAGNATDYDHYLACCEQLGVRNMAPLLDRMIVCDDIVANFDRHWRNFGIVRNVETLECRPAPLFDSGSSLWCNVETNDLAAGEHSFASKQFFESPAKQMLLVASLDWFDACALDGFVDEALEILSKNDALHARLSHIRRALDWRVERMRHIAEWD